MNTRISLVEFLFIPDWVNIITVNKIRWNDFASTNRDNAAHINNSLRETILSTNYQVIQIMESLIKDS